MENIKINGKTYSYIVNYRNNDPLRNSFNNLTRKTYEFDFEDWYDNGYWTNRYIPYSIVDENSVVSNVSVNVIDFLVGGTKRTFIQIGTVMTDTEYRNQGLNRILMEKVLEEWKGKCDLIYLFANDTVLDFYPKFGFQAVKEYEHSKEVNSEDGASDFIKLDMSQKENAEYLHNKINQALPVSQISMRNNAGLVMFYCTSFMKENIYYSKEFDAVVIADYQDGILHLNDIFCEKELPLNDVISSMSNKETKKVALGYTPNDITLFDSTVSKQEDVLFILDDKWGIFDDRKVKFPILSHA